MKRRLSHASRESVKLYTSSPHIAFEYDRHYEDTPLLEFDTLFLKSVLPHEGRLLDIGCGTARHLIELSRHGLSCVGMDLSEHMLMLSGGKLRAAGLSLPIVRADMTSPLPFASLSFDHVICMFSTIGLVPGSANRTAFVADVHRVVKPGGTLVLHVHNRWHNLFSQWGRRWLLQTYIWDRFASDIEVGDRVMEVYRGIRNMYLHIFSLGELKRLLKRAGFEMTRVTYLNDTRDGEVSRGAFKSLRANGFLIAAVKSA